MSATFVKPHFRHSALRRRPSGQAATPTRFVLLSTQRSGTSWVMERLAHHDLIGGYGEILLPGVEGWSDWPRGAADRPFFTTYLKEASLTDSLVTRHRRLFPYLDYLYGSRRSYQAIGFKLMYDQLLRYPELPVYFHARGVRVIHLIRTNLIDIALSREAMKTRRFVHARLPAERETISVKVDTERLLADLGRLEWERRIARATLAVLRTPVAEFTYESLLADDGLLSDAVRFLGVDLGPSSNLSAVMLKLAPSSHRAGIANYDEVQAALDGTRYRCFLHG